MKQSHTNFYQVLISTGTLKKTETSFFIFTGISRPTYIEARARFDQRNLRINWRESIFEEETVGDRHSLEWYYNEASILSLTAFHRSIDNVIAEETC